MTPFQGETLSITISPTSNSIDQFWASELAIPNFTPADWRSTLSPIECLEWCSLDARMIAVIVGEFDQRHSMPTDDLLQILLTQLLDAIRLFHR
nr:hypothetical protein [Tanacetum cinerariifolium]